MKRIYLGALISFAVCQFGLAAGNPLPPPVSDKLYTFQQIEQQKLDLNGKIVRIEIGSLLGDGKKPFARRVAALHRRGYFEGHNAFWAGGVSTARIAQWRIAG